nr:MAG TPA: Radical SAM superfamily [Caudoviricetes sp.]
MICISRCSCYSRLESPYIPEVLAISLNRGCKLQCKYTTKQGTEYGYR